MRMRCYNMRAEVRLPRPHTPTSVMHHCVSPPSAPHLTKPPQHLLNRETERIPLLTYMPTRHTHTDRIHSLHPHTTLLMDDFPFAK